MSFFFTEDKSAYRKWVNVITSLLLPGLGHFLSGRRAAGVIWFLANLGIRYVATYLSIFPYGSSIVLAVVAWAVLFLSWIWVAFDSCRKSIRPLKVGAWIGVCLVIIVIPFLATIPNRLFFRPFAIPTAAMMPTLMGNRKSPDGQMLKGDHIIVARTAYHLHPPRRGDVVVFKTEAINDSARERFQVPSGNIYVKRVVGLPGERVWIRPPAIYINGQKLVEPKIFETLFSQTNGPEGFAVSGLKENNEVQLGPEEFYVVGDNVSNSLDSRYFGPIKDGYFVGKVVSIFWPLDRRGFVQ